MVSWPVAGFGFGVLCGALELLYLIQAHHGLFLMADVLLNLLGHGALILLAGLLLSRILGPDRGWLLALFAGPAWIVFLRIYLERGLKYLPILNPAGGALFLAAVCLAAGMALLYRKLCAALLRTWMAGLGIGACFLLVFLRISGARASWQGDLPAAGPGRPNVLLVVLDTTRADHLSFMGHAAPTSPHLDTLAKSSTVFTQAYAPSPWTAPSHASLFTGLQPREHGVTLGNIGEGFSRKYLADGIPTLAGILAGAGYATASFSSNVHVQARTGITRGFAEDRYDVQYYLQRTVLRAAGSRLIRHLTGDNTLDRSARLGTDLILSWWRVRAGQSRPWFVFVNFSDPHLPYNPPASSLLQVSNGKPPGSAEDLRRLSGLYAQSLALCPWGKGVSPGDRKILEALYDGEIAYADLQTGRLLDYLEQTRQLDDTLIIVTSDHGEALGDHGWLGHIFQLYDSILHVPLLVRYPKVFPAGGSSPLPVSLCDLFPTVLETARVPTSAGSRTSALGLSDILGRAAGHGILVAEHDLPEWFSRQLFEGFPSAPRKRFSGTLFSVRVPGAKLLAWPDGTDEYFDLSEDPAEQDPRAGGASEHLSGLKSSLEEWKRSVPEFFPKGDRPMIPDEVKKKLHALGYF